MAREIDDGRRARRIVRPAFKREYREIKDEEGATKRIPRDFIELTVIGDARNSAVIPVETWLKKCERQANDGEIPVDWVDSYKAAYDRFVNGTESEEILEGTPLEQWPAIGVAMVESFRSKGLRTVEDVAAVTEGARKFFGPGFIGLQNKAKEWITGPAALRRENEELRARIEKLEQLTALLGV